MIEVNAFKDTTADSISIKNNTVIGVQCNLNHPPPPAQSLFKLWNVPPKNINFTGRIELFKQIKQLYDQKNSTVIITALHGLGGVGKTHLALEFVWQYHKNYNGVAWFNAVSRERLQESYISLGWELNIIRSDEKRDVKELARKVKHWLEDDSRADWLLVYDNAESYECIRELVPVKGGKILVTSRYSSGWPHQSISVNVFTIEESREYMKKILGEHLLVIDMDKLAEVLGRLPLALAQATAYIKKSRMNISRYLQLYEKRKRELLSKKKSLETDELLLESNESSQFTSVFITWDITMNAIRKESSLATNILSTCAYLASDNIPDFLLEKIAENPEINSKDEIPEEALGTLNDFSMITIKTNDGVSIHRLVQEVIQLKCKTSEKINYLIAVSHGFKSIVVNRLKLMEDFAQIRKLLPHLEMFLPHIENWKKDLEMESETKIQESHLKDILSLLAEWYDSLGYAQKALDLWKQVLVMNEKDFGFDHIEVATTLIWLGGAYINLGDYKKALETYERALPIQERHYGSDGPEMAETLTNIGNAHQYLGYFKKALEIYERALLIKEKHYGPNHPEVAITLARFGSAHGNLGNPKKAIEIYERTLLITERYYGTDHPEVAKTLTNLGNAYQHLGDYKKALEIYERALPITERHYGSDHPELARTLTNLGNAHYSLGDYRKALEMYEQALLIKERYYGLDHPEVAGTLGNLGNAYRNLGDCKKALEIYERSLSIKEKYYGSDHSEVAKTLGNLGLAHSNSGDYKKALDVYELALPIMERHYGSDHPNFAITLTCLGDVHNSLGDYEKAVEFQERALLIKERHYGSDHPEVAKTLTTLGIAYGNLGNYKKDLELQERALTIMQKHYGSDHTITIKVQQNYMKAVSLNKN